METEVSTIIRTKIVPFQIMAMIFLFINPSFGVQTSSLKLHVLSSEPSSRAVLMLADILQLKAKITDVLKDDPNPLQPEYLSLVPDCKPPVLQDGEFVISHSLVIMQYLAEAYGRAEHEHLYPRNVKERALVNQKLFFHDEYLKPAFDKFVSKLYHEHDLIVTKDRLKDIVKAYEHLDQFLATTGPYLCGQQMTIADLATLASVSSIAQFAEVIPERYPNLAAWRELMSKEEFHKKHNEPSSDLLFLLFEKTLRYDPDVAEYKPWFNRTDVHSDFIMNTIELVKNHPQFLDVLNKQQGFK